MELVVQEWAKKLSIPLAELVKGGTTIRGRQWGHLEGEIQKQVNNLSQKTQSEKDVADLQRRALVNFSNVRQAWRNTTMHPAAKYEEGEAEELLNHVVVFIRHLAIII